MAHRATPHFFNTKCNQFVVCICGDAIDDNTIKCIDVNELVPNLNSDYVNDKVHQLYFREMVDHDYGYNPDFYQFMLELVRCGHLTARTMFDVLIKPPGKTAPLLHSETEMVPSQVFHDWCYYSNIEKRIETGLDQEEIDLIKNHDFRQILKNYLASYNSNVLEKFEEIFPAPSDQINLREKLEGYPDLEILLPWFKKHGFILTAK